MERDIHPAETSLFVAAALRGYRLVDVPGGCYGVSRLNGGAVETVANRASFKEVVNLCGATDKTTLRQAAERDGLLFRAIKVVNLCRVKTLLFTE